MSPWKTIENSFFHLTFSVLNKQIKLGWYWKGRVYYGVLNLSFQTIDLLQDGIYPSERDRYRKEGYSGEISKQTTTDRGSKIKRATGVRPHVG